MNDEYFLQRCINLALKAEGNTSPNPMVGSVIVLQNKIIGEGYHTEAGKPHAEVNAINSVKDKSLLSEATIYVSLEPCSHFGKTPPCSDLIIHHKFKRVVVGSLDSNPLVAGRGIKKLQDAGIETKIGVLENECKKLNKRFFHFHTKKLPYVILKWAQTLDGFIDQRRNQNEKALQITNSKASNLVHQYRAIEDSILIGKNTLLKDNPSLNVRLVSGKNPIPIILGWSKDISITPKLFECHSKIYVFEEDEIEFSHAALNQIKINPKNLEKVLKFLAEKGIQSILVEGGTKVLESFYQKGLWQELKVFESDIEINKGVKGPNIDFKNNSITTQIESDLLFSKLNEIINNED